MAAAPRSRLSFLWTLSATSLAVRRSHLHYLQCIMPQLTAAAAEESTRMQWGRLQSPRAPRRLRTEGAAALRRGLQRVQVLPPPPLTRCVATMPPRVAAAPPALRIRLQKKARHRPCLRANQLMRLALLHSSPRPSLRPAIEAVGWRMPKRRQTVPSTTVCRRKLPQHCCPMNPLKYLTSCLH